MRVPIGPVDLTDIERARYDAYCVYMQTGATRLEIDGRIAIATWRAGTYLSRTLSRPLIVRLTPGDTDDEAVFDRGLGSPGP